MADKRNPYFKFYPSDFMGGVRGMTAQEVGVYTMLLCRMYEEGGPIGDDAFRLATYCGMRIATFTATLEKLVRLGKIEREAGALFNDRARREISSRADGLEVAIRAGKVSAEKRQRNQASAEASVDASFNYSDTDTDTDKRKREAIASPKKRAVQLPCGWVPSEKNVSDGQAKGFSASEIEDEADRFRDFHAAKGTTYKDWDAAWRTWLGNARKFSGRGMAGQASAGGYGQGGSIASIAARRRASGAV